MLDWFALAFGLLGYLHVLSGCYEWQWWWRLARGCYLPELVGWRKTRLIYIGIGCGMLAIGTSLFLQALFSSTSVIYWIVGFLAACFITLLSYNRRSNQSFSDLFKPDESQEKKA